ncbi:stage III sporulation protein AB [Extibacter sp. GGCC_0201]|uniref:stage III sporulation protein AB n=1 Tax=Extibacter sp. GGCC_0201 TaxID=2731209 RepID=UPI001AA1C4E0|nr:stage III sporulation protein AB [Extibacter sp. GGCC_0201]MBO1719231.1 hypothetical protein [Extibacter sp. GGCC_0201]BDF34110.1 hypothetical protein CE91St61_21850 [Lachnospiraceae bacterium]
MLKIAGGLLLIAGTTLMGMRAASGIQDEYRQMQYLQQIIYMLQSEIRYSRAYLGEAFLHIKEQVREPYAGWLFQMSRSMDKREGGMFSDIWETETEAYLSVSGLPQEERRRLAALGGRLGAADMDMQVKTLELYQEQLAVSMSEKREGMRTKMRLCRCLGVMSGIFLTVLLI